MGQKRPRDDSERLFFTEGWLRHPRAWWPWHRRPPATTKQDSSIFIMYASLWGSLARLNLFKNRKMKKNMINDFYSLTARYLSHGTMHTTTKEQTTHDHKITFQVNDYLAHSGLNKSHACCWRLEQNPFKKTCDWGDSLELPFVRLSLDE